MRIIKFNTESHIINTESHISCLSLTLEPGHEAKLHTCQHVVYIALVEIPTNIISNIFVVLAETLGVVG